MGPYWSVASRRVRYVLVQRSISVARLCQAGIPLHIAHNRAHPYTHKIKGCRRWGVVGFFLFLVFTFWSRVLRFLPRPFPRHSMCLRFGKPIKTILVSDGTLHHPSQPRTLRAPFTLRAGAAGKLRPI